MIVPNKKDSLHKAWLYRLLMAIYTNSDLADCLYFKGGTCAAMLGWLNRFSVDLDFDYNNKNLNIIEARKKLEKIFINLDLEIKDKSQKDLQYFLRYKSQGGEGSIIKIDTNFPFNKKNKYKISKFVEINKFIKHQTIETMFANKLLALIGRFEEGGSIAGRDVYDVYYFFKQGFSFDEEVIKSARRTTIDKFFKDLIRFVEKNVNQKIIDQDINLLMPRSEFKKIRIRLKDEVLFFLKSV
jgi:predicted nucleotidyltransferase component of viral defense system